jgi:hypothetical protein
LVGSNLVGFFELLTTNHAAQIVLSGIEPGMTLALVWHQLSRTQTTGSRIKPLRPIWAGLISEDSSSFSDSTQSDLKMQTSEITKEYQIKYNQTSSFAALKVPAEVLRVA